MMLQFEAMNTDVRVIAPYVGPSRQQTLDSNIRQLFATAEQRFSRFRPDSELSQLNNSHGPVVASPELFDALQRAHSYWKLTDGWFDVTIAHALCAAGYDRSFAPGVLDRKSGQRMARVRSATPEAICLDAATRTVELREGVAVDFGGFIKGWLVDRATDLLPAPAAVDAGGDASLRGDGPAGAGWRVDVEDPNRHGRVLLSFRVCSRAVATSGANRRRWRVGAEYAHHLIDPRTGLPSDSDVAQATVVAASCELADVLAKTVFLRGSRQGQRFLERFPDACALIVLRDGRIQRCGEVTQCAPS